MAEPRFSELPVEAFIALNEHFFPRGTDHLRFRLRDKRDTQDDPLDKYICNVLKRGLGKGVAVEESTGPLISPDMVVYRPATCVGGSRAELASRERSVFGLEVKKLNRTRSGSIARASGLDYNTTPPSGALRVYDANISPITIKGYYLFVCQESVQGQHRLQSLSALAFCDGDILNEDYEFYLSITGRRAKETGLGSYQDGANRIRPMLVFSNPLSAAVLDRQSTLIHARHDLEKEYDKLIKVGVIERTTLKQKDQEIRRFHCYRMRERSTGQEEKFLAIDPFKSPSSLAKTTQRGRFIVPIKTVA